MQSAHAKSEIFYFNFGCEFTIGKTGTECIMHLKDDMLVLVSLHSHEI